MISSTGPLEFDADRSFLYLDDKKRKVNVNFTWYVAIRYVDDEKGEKTNHFG